GTRPEYHFQLTAETPRILAGERRVRMVEIAHESVARAAKDRDVSHQLVSDERTTEGTLRAEGVVAASRQPHTHLRRVRGLAGHNVDGATHGVAPVERTLRTAQDLDPLDVEEIRECHRRAREIDAVEMNSGAGIRPGEHGIAADATDADLRQAGVLTNGERRNETGERFDGPRLELLERAGRYRRYRDGRRLDLGGSRLGGRDRQPLEEWHDGEGQIEPRVVPNFDLGTLRGEPGSRDLDDVATGRQPNELVSALIVGHDGASCVQRVAGDGHRHTGHD